MEPQSKKSLWDWPFEHKLISSSLSLAYGPLMHGILSLYAQAQGEKIDPANTEEVYIKLAVLGYVFNLYWLNMLAKIKRPKGKNFFKAATAAVKGIIGNIKKDPDLIQQATQRFLDATQFVPQESKWGIEAEDQILRGHFGQAFEYYTRYLDERKEKKIEFNDLFIIPGVRLLTQIQARLRGDIKDLLEEAFIDIGRNNPHLFTKTWPRILKEHQSLEIRIIHAMFLSVCERPEAQETWQKIEQENHTQKKQLGETRNEVYEINIPHIKEVVIIKKGSSCKREGDILKTIQGQDPDLIARPLAMYEQNGEFVLITKRKVGRNLEAYFAEEKDTERKKEEIRKTLERMRRLHVLPIDIPIYDPFKELERRLLERRGGGREAEILVSQYKKFEERRREGELLVTCHGDLYPSNILEGGILVDLERITQASPWLDIETFLAAPNVKREGTEEQLGDINPSGRIFYQIHTSLCQIGSFKKKAPETSGFYKQQVKQRLWEYKEEPLRKSLEQYLQATQT